MRHIMINGQEYRVSFRHINLKTLEELRDKGKPDYHPQMLQDEGTILEDALHKAFIWKQIKPYILTDYCTKKRLEYYPIFCPTGGTICELSQNKITVAIGFSFCSRKDQFSKKIGRQIALNRAKEDLKKNEPRQNFIYK